MSLSPPPRFRPGSHWDFRPQGPDHPIPPGYSHPPPNENSWRRHWLSSDSEWLCFRNASFRFLADFLTCRQNTLHSFPGCQQKKSIRCRWHTRATRCLTCLTPIVLYTDVDVSVINWWPTLTVHRTRQHLRRLTFSCKIFSPEFGRKFYRKVSLF